MNKFIKTYISTFLLFIFVSLNFAGGVHAQVNAAGDGGAFCDPEKFTMLKILDSHPTSLVSTMLVSSLGTLINVQPFQMAFGMSQGEAMGCAAYIAKTIPAVRCSTLGKGIISQNCPTSPDPLCKALMNQFEIGGGRRDGATNIFDTNGFATSKVSGSLLGYVYTVQNTVQYEPVPVNTAYFFKDYAAKLPIIGDEVYAANTTTYGHTLIDNVLSIWKIFRNIAYAMMSIIMLWVGFAIITRKRISSQTIVNVQYALPKIVIALVMIAFSYPIGALITSLSWTLWNNSRTIISSISGGAGLISNSCNLSFGETANSLQDLGFGGLMILIQKIMMGVSGIGLLPVITLLVIILMVFAIFASLKALWIYIKMVIYIATSPIQIALYALPGQDDKLEMWFKQMLAWGVGLFGMAMINWLTLTFALTLTVDAFQISGQQWTASTPIVSGTMFNIFIVPLLVVFGFSYSLKVPNMVEEMIVGKPRR